MRVSIIDTETTGLSPAEGKLIEVAVVNFDLTLGDVIEARSFLVLGAEDEEVEKTRPIHGIAPQLIRQHGTMTRDEVQRAIALMTFEYEAFIAHNADFDSQWFDPTSRPWVCTQNDIVWPSGAVNMSLANLALSHGVGIVSAHRAMEDCMTLARVLKRVAEKHDLVSLVRHGMRPKAKFKALVPYEQRDLAKEAGFKWDAPTKTWWRKMAIEDAGALKFMVQKI